MIYEWDNSPYVPIRALKNHPIMDEKYNAFITRKWYRQQKHLTTTYYIIALWLVNPFPTLRQVCKTPKNPQNPQNRPKIKTSPAARFQKTINCKSGHLCSICRLGTPVQHFCGRQPHASRYVCAWEEYCSRCWISAVDERETRKGQKGKKQMGKKEGSAAEV